SGPHGFLRTAAHAHADALSVEVRHGGVDVLADPATYCYHGEREWRDYFRSTAAHNTVELARSNQSRSGGPFLWLRRAPSRLIGLEHGPAGELRLWSAEHDGYRALSPEAGHRRTVRLDDERRTVTIVDFIETNGPHELALRFHLGPAVDAQLEGAVARLHWVTPATGTARCAVLALPEELRWRAHRGETDPVLGWYSSAFGEKAPATTLVGTGVCRAPSLEIRTTLEFA
ncbi:MAG TPA: heparinase II/III-family protein, partial [Acidimicrobiia bacterium]|nr:heparinase II/III-family protein [Acidimicrobiia bacterium]